MSGSGMMLIENLHVSELAIANPDEVGMLPCRSNSVCIFTAALTLTEARPMGTSPAEVDRK